MDQLRRIILEPHTAELIAEALGSGSVENFHPEDQDSHPFFDEKIRHLKLEELETLCRALDQEIDLQEVYLKMWGKRVRWEETSWDLSDIRAHKRFKDLMILVERLHHLKNIVNELIVAKITDYFKYCLQQLGFEEEEVDDIAREYGTSLVQLLGSGFPAYEIGDA